MINIIVPVVEDAEGFLKFVKSFTSKNVRFFVGVKKCLTNIFKTKSKNVEIHVFADKSSKEEIVNSLHTCALQKGKILIVRRPLTTEEFSALTKSEKDIVCLKAKHNKFVSAFKNFTKRLIRHFFAFTYFEDISAICYGESMFELLSVCQNLSMASRINKYIGVEIEEVETEQKQAKKHYSRPKNVLGLLAGILIFLGSLAGGICVCIFTKLKVLIVVVVVAWILIALMILFISIISFTRAIAVGNLRYGKAQRV